MVCLDFNERVKLLTVPVAPKLLLFIINMAVGLKKGRKTGCHYSNFNLTNSISPFLSSYLTSTDPIGISAFSGR